MFLHHRSPAGADTKDAQTKQCTTENYMDYFHNMLLKYKWKTQ